MSDMTTTAGIIERLEKATGQDREIDVRIWWVVMTPDFRAFFDSTGYITQVVEREWEAGSLLGLFYNSSETPPDRFDRAPHYTSSIDAALTLVPEGWGVAGLSNIMLDPKYHNVRAATGWSCIVDKIGNDYSHDLMRAAKMPKGFGPTPAIALCIAALRSRFNKGEG